MRFALSHPDTKAIILEEFVAARMQPIPDGNLGGRGYPDPDILPFCDWLNSFDGVYTLQSCAGHKPRNGHGASQGRLWVWLPARASDRLRARACEFVRSPIDQISTCYRSNGEFLELVFQGNESGQLDKSLAALEVMFKTILED